MKKSHLFEPYILTLLDREFEKYNKADSYLDKEIKIPPIVLYFMFNHNNNYFYYGW